MLTHTKTTASYFDESWNATQWESSRNLKLCRQPEQDSSEAKNHDSVWCQLQRATVYIISRYLYKTGVVVGGDLSSERTPVG